MVELITKHYNILGKRLPIEIHFYTCNSITMGKAYHKLLNLTYSFDIDKDYESDLVYYFESMLSHNMSVSNTINLDEYIDLQKL